MKKGYTLALVILAAGAVFLARSFSAGGVSGNQSEAQGAAPGPPARKRETMSPEQIERLREESKRTFRDRVLDEEKNRHAPPSPLLDQAGQITPQAADAAMLTPEERDKVKLVMANLFKTYLNSAMSTATFSRVESDREHKIAVFDIPAAPDRGESGLQDLKMQLGSAVGQEKADILTKSFDLGGVLGYFGREDIKIRFDYANDDLEKQGVKIEYFSAESGMMLRHTEMNKVEFMRKFPTELPPIPQG